MSPSDFTSEPEFIQDGHILTFVLDRDEIKISGILCPNKGATAQCNRRRTFCVVERFLDAFGIDLNLGTASLQGPIEIAWCPIPGDESDLDDEFDTIWIVPIDDPNYRLMMDEREGIFSSSEPGMELPAIEAPNDEDEEE